MSLIRRGQAGETCEIVISPSPRPQGGLADGCSLRVFADVASSANDPKEKLTRSASESQGSHDRVQRKSGVSH